MLPRMRRSALLSLIPILFFAACGPAPTTGGTDGGTPADPRIQAQWTHPAACGMAPYQWLKDPRLGTLVAYGAADPDHVSVGDLSSVLGQLGFKLARPFVYDVKMYRYRYWTQDRGQMVQATGLLAVPQVGGNADHPFPMLLYLHGTSGFNDDCAPSRSLTAPVEIAGLASFGYIVTAPDYLGMNGWGAPSTQMHPYLVAEPTAIASLDALRAGRVMLQLGLGGRATAVPQKYLILGGSQGGHAALFTSRFSPYYAPEEKLVAVAASVPPADLVHEASRAAQQLVSASANMAAASVGYSDWYGVDLSTALMPPYDTELPPAMSHGCKLSGINPMPTSVDQVFTPGFRNAAAADFPEEPSDVWGCMLRQNSLTTTPIARLQTVPTFWVLSEDDTLVNTPIEQKSFDTLCAQGMKIQYLECAGVGHTGGAIGSIAEQTHFLDDRWAGKPWPAADICHRTAPVVCSGNK